MKELENQTNQKETTKKYMYFIHKYTKEITFRDYRKYYRYEDHAKEYDSLILKTSDEEEALKEFKSEADFLKLNFESKDENYFTDYDWNLKKDLIVTYSYSLDRVEVDEDGNEIGDFENIDFISYSLQEVAEMIDEVEEIEEEENEEDEDDDE